MIIISTLHILANDAEYRTSGNQLIPVENTDVRLDKEVLSITRFKSDNTFKVDVNYTLFNEQKERTIIIGFEAPKAVGDREPQQYFGFPRNDSLLLKSERKSIKKIPIKKGHDYIYDFKVIANGKEIIYKIVDSELIGKDNHSSSYIGYLYYFQMKLKKGINTLHHSYRFDGQGSVHYAYEFTYILETARRWKDEKIGDFTLILDMGKHTQFSVLDTFFYNANSWKIKGIGKSKYFSATPDNHDWCEVACNNRVSFYMDNGKAIYHENNFTPKSIVSLNSEMGYFDIFDSKKDILWVSHNFTLPALATDVSSLQILKSFPDACQGKKMNTKITKKYYSDKTDWYKEGKIDTRTYPTIKKYASIWLEEIEKNKHKILRNLPFAKRGYIFKDYSLATFFRYQKWYKPNKQYNTSLFDLSVKELKWRENIIKKEIIDDNEFFKLIEEYERIYK